MSSTIDAHILAFAAKRCSTLAFFGIASDGTVTMRQQPAAQAANGVSVIVMLSYRITQREAQEFAPEGHKKMAEPYGSSRTETAIGEAVSFANGVLASRNVPAGEYASVAIGFG